MIDGNHNRLPTDNGLSPFLNRHTKLRLRFIARDDYSKSVVSSCGKNTLLDLNLKCSKKWDDVLDYLEKRWMGVDKIRERIQIYFIEISGELSRNMINGQRSLTVGDSLALHPSVLAKRQQQPRVAGASLDFDKDPICVLYSISIPLPLENAVVVLATSDEQRHIETPVNPLSTVPHAEISILSSKITQATNTGATAPIASASTLGLRKTSPPLPVVNPNNNLTKTSDRKSYLSQFHNTIMGRGTVSSSPLAPAPALVIGGTEPDVVSSASTSAAAVPVQLPVASYLNVKSHSSSSSMLHMLMPPNSTTPVGMPRYQMPMQSPSSGSAVVRGLNLRGNDGGMGQPYPESFMGLTAESVMPLSVGPRGLTPRIPIARPQQRKRQRQSQQQRQQQQQQQPFHHPMMLNYHQQARSLNFPQQQNYQGTMNMNASLTYGLPVYHSQFQPQSQPQPIYPSDSYHPNASQGYFDHSMLQGQSQSFPKFPSQAQGQPLPPHQGNSTNAIPPQQSSLFPKPDRHGSAGHQSIAQDDSGDVDLFADSSSRILDFDVDSRPRDFCSSEPPCDDNLQRPLQPASVGSSDNQSKDEVACESTNQLLMSFDDCSLPSAFNASNLFTRMAAAPTNTDTAASAHHDWANGDVSFILQSPDRRIFSPIKGRIGSVIDGGKGSKKDEVNGGRCGTSIGRALFTPPLGVANSVHRSDASSTSSISAVAERIDKSEAASTAVFEHNYMSSGRENSDLIDNTELQGLGFENDMSIFGMFDNAPSLAGNISLHQKHSSPTDLIGHISSSSTSNISSSSSAATGSNYVSSDSDSYEDAMHTNFACALPTDMELGDAHHSLLLLPESVSGHRVKIDTSTEAYHSTIRLDHHQRNTSCNIDCIDGIKDKNLDIASFTEVCRVGRVDVDPQQHQSPSTVKDKQSPRADLTSAIAISGSEKVAETNNHPVPPPLAALLNSTTRAASPVVMASGPGRIFNFIELIQSADAQGSSSSPIASASGSTSVGDYNCDLTTSVATSIAPHQEDYEALVAPMVLPPSSSSQIIDQIIAKKRRLQSMEPCTEVPDETRAPSDHHLLQPPAEIGSPLRGLPSTPVRTSRSSNGFDRAIITTTSGNRSSARLKSPGALSRRRTVPRLSLYGKIDVGSAGDSIGHGEAKVGNGDVIGGMVGGDSQASNRESSEPPETVGSSSAKHFVEFTIASPIRKRPPKKRHLRRITPTYLSHVDDRARFVFNTHKAFN